MRRIIDRQWDGAHLPPSEHATVTLAIAGGRLRVDVEAPFAGDPPPAAPPGSLDGLWEHEVVEVFVVGQGEPVPYLEVELGPHGHHLALRLRGVRVREGILDATSRCEVVGDRWRGTVELSRDVLPPGPYRVNAVAIRGVGAARRYLSADPLPGPRPDFHQPHAFTARWDPR